MICHGYHCSQKADKHALDNKVSRSHFDGAVDELSRNLNDVMDKLSGHVSTNYKNIFSVCYDILINVVSQIN